MTQRYYTTTDIAKEYQLSARELNRLLLHEQIVRRGERGYELATHHQKKGFEQVFTRPYVHSDGTPDESYTMKWTEVGKMFIEAEMERMGFMKGV